MYFKVEKQNAMGEDSYDSIKEIFISSQTTSAKHQKNAILLKRLQVICMGFFIWNILTN